MEDTNKPMAPQPSPEDRDRPASDSQETEEIKAPDQPVSALEAPAQPQVPAVPKTAPVPDPNAPAAPQAPKVPPAPPAPQAPAAGPVPAPAAAPAAAPTQPMGGPAQPGGPMPQPGPAPMGAYPPPPPPVAPVKNNKAVVALICGILAIVFSFIPIAGIILGVVAIVFASKAVRMFGRDGKATGGKVCGIIGIVISVLWIVLTVAMMMFAFTMAPGLDRDYDDSLPGYVSSSNASSSWSSAAGAVDMDADQQAVYDQVVVLFDGIVAKDEKFKGELSEEYAESFEQNFGADYAEMGIDSAAFAEWVLTDFSYEIDSVFVDGDTATVYVDTTERDVFDFLMNFGDAVAAYSQTIDADTVADVEAKAKVAELFSQTMADTTEMTTYFAAFDFVKQGDAWIIDEDSAEEEFDYMFGTF